MEKETLVEEVEKLINEEKFYKVINKLTDDILKKNNKESLYVIRGNAFYHLKSYDKALADYDAAIQIEPKSQTGYYNKGLTQVAMRKYQEAIKTCSIIISFNSEDYSTYFYRGSIYGFLQNYALAIADYTETIKLAPEYANAYYSRGLAYYEKAIADEEFKIIHKSKNDFNKYLVLSSNEKDIWTTYAEEYIKEIDDILSSKNLLHIITLIDKIKSILLVDNIPATHYTSLTTLQSLILDNSKFRISEGNYMNDPSEGEALFDFLDINSSDIDKTFYPKPFIGSFVIEQMSDNLNMWRFYGKESGKEAKGCSITIETQEFIDIIRNKFSNEFKERRLENESDISFYHIAYINSKNNFICVPNSTIESELKKMMEDLKNQFNISKPNISLVRKYLNQIAFLFKNDSFMSENELRLVITGFEFKKEYNTNVFPPKIFIELESIKDITKKITFGPNVENSNEWSAALFYSYAEKPPTISKSILSYK